MGLIKKLEIRVSAVQFQSNEVVHLRFTGNDLQGQINLNGYVVTTEDEYFENATRPAMTELVKTKIIERIENNIEETEEMLQELEEE